MPDKQVDELQVVTAEPRRMLTEAQVLDLLPFGRTTLFSLIKGGCFPRGTYVSPNRRAWFADEIARWQNTLGECNPHFNPSRGRGRRRRSQVAAVVGVPPLDTS
jgi:prophage regulatory protein